MIVQPADFGKPRSLSPEFASLLSLCWRNGVYGYFWYASLLRYSEEEAKAINKKGVRQNGNKVTLTTWHPCNKPLPSVLPPQSFRSPFYGLSYRLLKNRFITPDDPSFLHAYFGVNPVSPKPSHLRKWKYGARGRKNAIQAVNVFIGDLDVKDFGGDWQALWHYVENDLLLPPTAIIFTGGGVQIFFGLRQTFSVFENGAQDKERLNQIDTLYKRWNDVHEKFDRGAKDLSRAFRCENTINGKEKYGPNFPTTRSRLLDLSCLVDISDIEATLPVTIVVPHEAPAAPRKRGEFSRERAKRAKSATKSTTTTLAASQPSSWLPPTFESLPSFASQRQKIDWHLQYFNHDTYGDWKLVGLALSGEVDGYTIWAEWSRKSHKFEEAIQQDEWVSIQKERKQRIEGGQTVAGFGLLVKRARERGCPLVRDVGEYQPIRKQNLRVNLCVLRGGVGEALANWFCPDGESWALLNPVETNDEIDHLLSAPKQKPLRAAILDHIAGNTRRWRVGGLRRRVKTCVVVMAMSQPMTRLWAIGARDAQDARLTQEHLASMGLRSISYPLCSQLHFFSSQITGWDYNGHFPIPYIYKADALSTNNDLGKMGKQSIKALKSPDTTRKSVIEHIVLVAFSKPIPQQLLQHATHTPQLDPYPLPLNLPCSSPPFSREESLKISLFVEQEKEIVTIGCGDAGFFAWDDLLKRDIFNDPMALTGLQVESNPQIREIVAQAHKITESIESVARWHNRRALTLKAQACGCGQVLMTFDSNDGYEAGWCPSCGGEPVTNFTQTAHAQAKTLDELAVTITVDNQLGQAGDYVIEYQPETTAAVDMAAESAHRELVASIRKQLEEDLKQGIADGSFKGKIIVIDMTAGGGKSTIVRKMIRRWWHEYKLLSRITTDTKRLAFEWNEELGSLLIRSFVFQSLTDCCECFPVEVKVQAIARGYGLSHSQACLYVAQINELLRGGDKKQKEVAILRHQHLRIRLQNRRLVAGADIYISDENFLGGLLERDSISLQELEGTLRRMQKANCTPAEMAIPTALFEVARKQRVAQYQHVDGEVFVQLVEDWLKQRGLTVAFCLEAIKKTKFAQRPRLEASDFESDTDIPLDLPKQWVRKFLEAFEQTIKNPVHPSFFLEQASKSPQFSQLRLAWGVKHEYLPEYNRPLDEAVSYHLLLDATPNRLILEALLPEWEIDFRSYKIPPSPLHRFIQIDGLNLTRQNLRENFKPTFSKLLAILNDLDLLVDAAVTRLDIKDKVGGNLGLDDSMVLTFRNQRGSNRLKDASTILVFGDATIPTNAALRLAHILWSHDTKPFETYSNGSHFTKSGGLWIAKDKRVQAVLDQVREEGIQGTGRGRLINGDVPKTIISVSNFDLAELIDGLDKSRVERIDAKRLHGNSRKVRYALDTYGDRVRDRDDERCQAKSG